MPALHTHASAPDVDCIVVGAGIVGLAVARALALGGREVIVIEATDAIGTETSSRNSEVIHAGIYYPTGSLKARTCVRGKQLLYAYCDAHGVPYRRLGKLIVAAREAERDGLAALKQKAAANGVGDLEWVDRDTLRALEPALAGEAALLSPSTGIVDSHALMLAYQGDAEAAGAMIAFNSPVAGGRVIEGGIALSAGGAEPMTLAARLVVNCAGLDAPGLSRAIRGVPEAPVPRAYLAKGSYYTLAGRAPFSRLIYPMPEPGGLGVHLTLDLAGRARFGPDVEWIDEPEYSVDPRRADAFYERIRRYWPALQDGALSPAYAGVRPKIEGPGGLATDFRIDGPSVHGVPGIVNLLGIESPGLTAALAIADYAAAIVT